MADCKFKKQMQQHYFNLYPLQGTLHDGINQRTYRCEQLRKFCFAWSHREKSVNVSKKFVRKHTESTNFHQISYRCCQQNFKTNGFHHQKIFTVGYSSKPLENITSYTTLSVRFKNRLQQLPSNICFIISL